MAAKKAEKEAEKVSIPFKRESVSKGSRSGCSRSNQGSFNSLQTGKCIQRSAMGKPTGSFFQFQFPSNGKVYPKMDRNARVDKALKAFQFPSNGKVYPKRPYFSPSWAVAPEPQNPTRTARAFFVSKFILKIP